MKRRLMMVLAAGALVSAMVPGVAAAGAPEAKGDGGCHGEGLNFGKVTFVYLDTSAGMRLGQVIGGYYRFKASCRTPDSYGSLTIDGVLVDSFLNS